MNLLALAGALLIGLTLGLTGAGGSIVTLPVLVYLAGVTPQEAVPMSLFIVGAAALTGAVQRWRQKEICLHTAGVFAVSGMAGAALGAQLTPLVPPLILMAVFACLMLFVAALMLRPRKEPHLAEEPEAGAKPNWASKAVAGGLVGVLTGFIGVGGGFLLVPALLRFGRLNMREAVGSSLAIIFFNCVAGFLSHLGQAQTDWQLAVVYSVLACLGVLVGTRMAGKISPVRLRQAFAGMVIVTGLFVLWSSLAALR